MSEQPLSIRRRDFLNGVLIWAGGSLLGAGGVQSRAADGRMLRGGNTPSTLRIAHWLRDDRLRFANSRQVILASTPTDSMEGAFDIELDSEVYDLIVVGSGLSGLMSAFQFQKRYPKARILIVDVQEQPGGNAGRDEGARLPGLASTGGAYAAFPYADFFTETYQAIGIDYEKYAIAAPGHGFFFDSMCPFVAPGTKRWVADAFGADLEKLPYDAETIADFKSARADLMAWHEREGGPTDPPDESDPRFDGLGAISFKQYLEQKKYRPAVVDFYSRYSADALGGLCEHVSAHAAIAFLGAEYHPLFAPPGGTSAIARAMVRALVPGAFAPGPFEKVLRKPMNLDALDVPGEAIRIRQRALAVRADSAGKSASLVYYCDGKFHRSIARSMILAGQGHTTRLLVDHLVDDATRSAWISFSRVPTVVANVVLRSSRPLTRLGLGYNQYYWGSEHWADFVIADWTSTPKRDRNRPVTLTFYGGNERPPEELPAERLKLLNTPFSAYEASLRKDTARLFAGAGFDFDRDVRAIYLYRWGHSLLLPRPGFSFQEPLVEGEIHKRVPAMRHLAKQPLGRVFIAGQDVEGTASVESALGSGRRAAEEAL